MTENESNTKYQPASRTAWTARTALLLLLTAALLSAACTRDEATTVAAEEQRVVIAFDCQSAAATRAANGTTGPITTENGHLLYTGFGVFAREEGATGFDYMSNQKIAFNFQASEPEDFYDGYWYYNPLKYWPHKYDDVQQKNVAKTMAFCAYAPYVERPADDFADDPAHTGIIGMSPADTQTPYIIYRRSERREELVDLLWAYMEPSTAKAVNLKMYHALARVAVKVQLTNSAEDLASKGIDKVLVEQVRLEGKIASEGRLELSGYSVETPDAAVPASLEGKQTELTPRWSGQKGNGEADPVTAIVIDHDPDAYHEENSGAYSYGIIAESARYITGLPKSWQPAGLQAGAEPLNILTQDDDQPTYLLLIPQPELTLTAHITFRVFKTDNTESTERRTGTPLTVAEPLNGNTPYSLNLEITI